MVNILAREGVLLVGPSAIWSFLTFHLSFVKTWGKRAFPDIWEVYVANEDLLTATQGESI